MKSFYLALAVLLVISCSLTNGAAGTILSPPPESPTAAQVVQSTPTPRPTPSRCTVDTGAAQGRLNMRACAGTNCGVIEVLDEGEILTVIDAGSWYHVQTEAGAAGYINSSYCRGAK